MLVSNIRFAAGWDKSDRDLNVSAAPADPGLLHWAAVSQARVAHRQIRPGITQQDSQTTTEQLPLGTYELEAVNIRPTHHSLQRRQYHDDTVLHLGTSGLDSDSQAIILHLE
jgi:hypothetical protein